MGLYGSPDLSNQYGNLEEYEKQEKRKPPKFNRMLWFIIIINVLVLWGAGFSKENILTILMLDSIIVFIYSFVMMIFNLYKKRSIASYGTMIGVAVVTFLASAVMLGTISSDLGHMGRTDESILEDVIDLGSRKNPAKIGDVIQTRAVNSEGLECIIEVELTDFKRGKDAEDIMRSGGSSASNPGEGKEYALVKFKVGNLEDVSGKDIPFSLSSIQFSYSTGSFAVTNMRWDVPGLNSTIGADLYEGAEHEGWVCFSIEIDDLQPKAVFLDNLWFDL